MIEITNQQKAKFSNPAPIVLFVYNRPWHTQQTLEALQKNELSDQSDLIIYCDAPKNDEASTSVQEVRDYVKTVNGFKSVKIIERDKNWGLAANIIDGVTEVVNENGKIIVMEDDLVTSPFFLRYMNDALSAYEFDDEVGCIHGYIYPINGLESDFFINGSDCWGWGTWSRAWKFFEQDGVKLLEIVKSLGYQNDPFNVKCGYIKMLEDQIAGKNDSWAVRWYFSSLIVGKKCLYPSVSYVNNIGLDYSGTHCGVSDRYSVVLNSTYNFKKIVVEENLLYKDKIMTFLSQPDSISTRIISIFKRVFKKWLR